MRTPVCTRSIDLRESPSRAGFLREAMCGTLVPNYVGVKAVRSRGRHSRAKSLRTASVKPVERPRPGIYSNAGALAGDAGHRAKGRASPRSKLSYNGMMDQR